MIFSRCRLTRLVVKVRDGQVANRPIYVVIGVTVNGERDRTPGVQASDTAPRLPQKLSRSLADLVAAGVRLGRQRRLRELGPADLG